MRRRWVHRLVDDSVVRVFNLKALLRKDRFFPNKKTVQLVAGAQSPDHKHARVLNMFVGGFPFYRLQVHG